MRGFTLVELLVTLGVMAVIMAAVLVAIDPVDKINGANDARAISDMGQVATAIKTYSTSNSGSLNATGASVVAWTGSGSLASMLSLELPTFPTTVAGSGRVAYTPFIPSAGTSAVIYTSLISKKYANKCTDANNVAFVYWDTTPTGGSGTLCGYCNLVGSPPSTALTNNCSGTGGSAGSTFAL